MPAQLMRLRSTGAVYIKRSCEVCGGDAYLGTDMRSYCAALDAAEKGKMELAIELLGKWYCLKHWKEL